MIRRDPPPRPDYEFESEEERYLYHILKEQHIHTKRLYSIGNAVWVIAWIMILGIVLSCLLAVFGRSLLF